MQAIKPFRPLNPILYSLYAVAFLSHPRFFFFFWDSDKWVYVLMFLEGVGSLFPWNAFITVTPYFTARLANSPFSVRQSASFFSLVSSMSVWLTSFSLSSLPRQDNFINYFTFTFQLVNIAFLALEVRIKSGMDVHKRILVPLVLQLVVFSIMFAFTNVSESFSRELLSLTSLIISSPCA